MTEEFKEDIKKKAVANDKWKIALKTASEAVKELVFKNMSERAWNYVRRHGVDGRC